MRGGATGVGVVLSYISSTLFMERRFWFSTLPLRIICYVGAFNDQVTFYPALFAQFAFTHRKSIATKEWNRYSYLCRPCYEKRSWVLSFIFSKFRFQWFCSVLAAVVKNLREIFFVGQWGMPLCLPVALVHLPQPCALLLKVSWNKICASWVVLSFFYFCKSRSVSNVQFPVSYHYNLELSPHRQWWKAATNRKHGLHNPPPISHISSLLPTRSSPLLGKSAVFNHHWVPRLTPLSQSTPKPSPSTDHTPPTASSLFSGPS